MMRAVFFLACIAMAPPKARRPPRVQGPHAAVSIPLGSGNFATSSFKVAVAMLATTLPAMLASGRILRKGTHIRSDIGRNNQRNKIVGKLLRIDKNSVELYVKQWKTRGVTDADAEAGVQNFLPAPRQHGRAALRGRDVQPSLFDFIRQKINDAKAVGATISIPKLRDEVQAAAGVIQGDVPAFYYSFRRSLLKMGFAFGRIRRRIKSRRDGFVDWLLEYARRRHIACRVPDDTTVHLHLDETSVWRDEGGNFSWHLPEDEGGNIWPMNVGNLPHTRWSIAMAMCAYALYFL